MTTQSQSYHRTPITSRPVFAYEPQHRRGAVVCTYFSRAEAQAAVERLVRSGITMDSIAIEQENLPHLNAAEQASPQAKTLWRAASIGAVVGLLLGIALGMLSGMAPLGAFVDLATNGLVMGILTGLILGVVFYTLDDSDYDRYWRLGLASAQYNIVVEPQLVGAVHRILFSLAPLDMFADSGSPG